MINNEKIVTTTYEVNQQHWLVAKKDDKYYEHVQHANKLIKELRKENYVFAPYVLMSMTIFDEK
jgi:hypothetical protein